MESLDQQLAAYRDIQDWLAGKKPPGQGRITWRRQMQMQVQKALPGRVRRAVYTVAPRALERLPWLGLGVVMVTLAPLLADAVVGSMGAEALPLAEVLHSAVHVLTMAGKVALGLSAAFMAFCLLIAGD